MTTESDDGPTASAEREIDALRPIEIVGDVVRRPAQAWTPTVHAFLRHLRSAGLDCVPEPIGLFVDTITRYDTTIPAITVRCTRDDTSATSPSLSS